MYVHMLYEYVYGKYNTYTLYISEKKKEVRVRACCLLLGRTYTTRYMIVFGTSMGLSFWDPGMAG